MSYSRGGGGTEGGKGEFQRVWKIPASMEDSSKSLNLKPRLGMFDAVATGLAAILGAGIFAVISPAALRLRKDQRRLPRLLSLAGLVGCIGLAFSLAAPEIAVGLGILAVGLGYRTLRLAVENRRDQRDS